MSDSVRIQTGDFSVEEEVRLLHDGNGRIGGIVTFLGTARDLSRGRNVSQLEFEEYAGMAVKAMNALRDEAMEQFDIIDMRIVHRIGAIQAGEQIVLIIAGAAHRAAAFDACEWCIDTLKQIVPIWKKEITPTGESWVEEHP
ncbi:MAG: molybdenum cofactor biosynthesis protein MoaE [Mariprofundaceae bacterium]|nr:molybdenum cofactor biosynthesis protein MoaE [Mariprofundaceae bacterium]